MSPASILSVELIDDNHVKVFVTEQQAPLAIGKGGINVSLASRLTGFEIDIIQTKEETKEEIVEAEKIDEKAAEVVKDKKTKK